MRKLLCGILISGCAVFGALVSGLESLAQETTSQPATQPATRLAAEVDISLPSRAVYYSTPEVRGNRVNLSDYENPCKVDVVAVFNSLEPYRRIIDERIQKDTTRHWIYITQANKEFRARIVRAAMRNKYDAVIDSRVARNIDIPDITSEVISRE